MVHRRDDTGDSRVTAIIQWTASFFRRLLRPRNKTIHSECQASPTHTNTVMHSRQRCTKLHTFRIRSSCLISILSKNILNCVITDVLLLPRFPVEGVEEGVIEHLAIRCQDGGKYTITGQVRFFVL